MPLTFPTLALGGTLHVPTPAGEPHEIEVPAGTQPGARFRIRGKGMPSVTGRGHGDLYLIARAVVPKKLTREQKQLLEQLARTMPQEKVEASKAHDERPFFERVKDIFG
jgi:molecular chaperone DnaJ